MVLIINKAKLPQKSRFVHQFIPKSLYSFIIEANRKSRLPAVRKYTILIIDEADKLPKADMVIANLLIEYIGYECFQNAIRQVNPKYVSCIIQINMEDSWVSDSPYLLPNRKKLVQIDFER